MIPLRLTLKNFMCYRDNVPTLELENLHVACLCGDNGHGKTALLDAITWALWGQARARTQEELVHQGQRDMAVDLEFLARGQRYRVSRSHSRSARSRQGTTLLELQVASDNGLQPITGNSVRDTEARIRDILHMDYDTFINTAFLRQGDADRFTTSSPSKRKETLAEVLDLSYYQGLEQRANDLSHSIQAEILGLERDVARGQEEVARRPEHEALLSSVTVELARIEPEVETQRAKVEELRHSVDQLHARRSELDDLARRMADSQRDASHLESQVRSHQARISDYEAALQTEPEIREQFRRLEEFRAELERLNQALARQRELENLKADLEKEIAVQKERLSGQATRLRERISQELDPSAKRLPEIEESLRAMAQEQAKLSELEGSVHQHRKEVEEVSSKSRDLQLANERLHQEMQETRKKFDMLEQGDTICPLCKQPLDMEGQDHLRREYEALGQESKGQYQENAVQRSALDKRHQELTAALSKLEAELKQGREQTQSRMANLERDKAEAQKAQAELQAGTAELQRAESFIRKDSFAPNERRQLSQLQTEISALGYDVQRHRQAQEQGKALESYDELHRRLQEAVEALPAEREALETAQQILKRHQHEVRSSQERTAVLEEELKNLPALESQLTEAQHRLRSSEGETQEALVRKAVAERELERCDALEINLRDQLHKHRTLLDKKSVYQELAVAFGKNGIQALIIESAIPQLDADANQLLGRLTDNRMTLKLQVQEGRRDGRTGLPSEELEIKIADEVGTRSYETFSGGEAFRINFALRIALSKLLARRSGAPLPILFIDEGFGSQDSAGQERLTEAIQSIQDDFQKIIVITHIDQIKESFPVRIEVTKTGSGSTFAIV